MDTLYPAEPYTAYSMMGFKDVVSFANYVQITDPSEDVSDPYGETLLSVLITPLNSK